jgi:hypothetical protein
MENFKKSILKMIITKDSIEVIFKNNDVLKISSNGDAIFEKNIINDIALSSGTDYTKRTMFVD